MERDNAVRVARRAGVASMLGAALLLVVATTQPVPAGRSAPAQALTDLIPPMPLGSSGGVWLPTFRDEFEGTVLDPGKWTNGFGWGETAAHVVGYCDPAANVVQGGVLIQRADNIPQMGRPYTAACIHTKNKFFQLYGYWEARMKVPRGNGLHSAFWAKPNDESWPPEFDVEEISGKNTGQLVMSVHWQEGGAHRLSNRKFNGPDFAADYHVFGLEWAPEQTIWYLDGVEQFRTGGGAAFMDDRGPFYTIVNLQVGLRGLELPDASTPWPAYQYVDYVRVWDRPLALLPLGMR